MPDPLPPLNAPSPAAPVRPARPPRHTGRLALRRAALALAAVGATAAAPVGAQPAPAPASASVDVGAPAPAASAPPRSPADPVPVARRAFHSFCPFAVAQPSVTLVSTDAAWRAALARSPMQPPPYAATDLDAARHQVLIVAGPATPGPTASMALAGGPLAVAYGPSSQRLSVRIVFKDAPTAPGMMGAAVVGQPCLVLWIELRRPVREVVARTTEDRVLGVVRLP